MPKASKQKPPELNIFPGNWTIKNEQMFKAFDLSFAQHWNPANFPWEELDGKNFDPKERIAQAYWMSKLALFEKSGIGAFGLEQSVPPSLTWKTLPRRCSRRSHMMNAVMTKYADELATSSAPTGPMDTNPSQTLNRKR